MIKLDTAKAPMGHLGRQRLLHAIYSASAADENEWVEFKAGIDPTTKAGFAHIARAIIAFANRDPIRAQRWMEGNAYVVVGLEPGNAPGANVADPAIIHDGVNALIASPAPAWDLEYTTFGSTQVLVVTVEPPQPGDPIHCIGKAAPEVDNGNIFVRRPGKSDRAKSDDIRRLSNRLISANRDSIAIDVSAHVPEWDGVPQCVWSENWEESWISTERRVLLAPLERHLNPLDRSPLGAFGTTIDASLAASSSVRGLMDTPEDRSPEAYRDEVEDYLEACLNASPGAERRAAARVLPLISWSVENLSDDNLDNLLVTVHVEGEVTAHERIDNFSLRPWEPKRPRVWGPRKISDGFGLTSQMLAQSLPSTYGPSALRPFIQNGGSATIEFPSLHVRPRTTELLEAEIVLMVSPAVTGSIRCTWKATATNLSAVAEGETSIPVLEEQIDLSPLLAHREPRPWVLRPGEQSDDPADDHDW